MSDVIGWSRSTYNDGLYQEDTRPGATAAAGGIWPVDPLTFESVVEEGDVISITATFWARSGDPVIKLGRYEGSPAIWVDETSLWTELEPYREGDFWARTWYRVATSVMIAYAFVDIAVMQPPLALDVGGPDGGQVWGLCWRGATSVQNVYGVASSGTTHDPPTTDPSVANFYVGGPGDAVVDDPVDDIQPAQHDSSGSMNKTEWLDDSKSASFPFAETELFGTAFYKPADEGSVGGWTTGIAQDALLVGISSAIEGSAQIEPPIAGVVHLGALS